MKTPASVLPKVLRRAGARRLRLEIVPSTRNLRVRLSTRHQAFKDRTFADRDRRLARQAARLAATR